MLTARCRSLGINSLNELDLSTGLYSNSVYQIIDLIELEYHKGDRRLAQNTNSIHNEKLVKLWSHNGSGRWTGEWNEQDSRWDSKLASRIGLREEGVVVMKFRDFCEFFEGYQTHFMKIDSVYSA